MYLIGTQKWVTEVVWHFSAKSHIDVKRVYSCFGNIIRDNTVQKALDSMTVLSLNIL